jgi:TPR repeat protein
MNLTRVSIFTSGGLMLALLITSCSLPESSEWSISQTRDELSNENILSAVNEQTTDAIKTEVTMRCVPADANGRIQFTIKVFDGNLATVDREVGSFAGFLGLEYRSQVRRISPVRLKKSSSGEPLEVWALQSESFSNVYTIDVRLLLRSRFLTRLQPSLLNPKQKLEGAELIAFLESKSVDATAESEDLYMTMRGYRSPQFILGNEAEYEFNFSEFLLELPLSNGKKRIIRGDGGLKKFVDSCVFDPQGPAIEKAISDALGQLPAMKAALKKETAEKQYSLGVKYRDGDGVEKDLVKAAKLLGEAADAGSADAQNDLGAMYLEGESVKKDWSVAMSWFRKSADQGNAVAALNLARQFYFGQDGTGQDLSEAKRWATTASDRGIADARFLLSSIYSDEGDLGQAERLLNTLVDEGNNEARIELGSLLFEQQRYSETHKILYRLAEQGEPTAAGIVGYLHALQHITAPERVFNQRTMPPGISRSIKRGNIDPAAFANFRAACLYSDKAHKGGDLLGTVVLADCYLYGRDGRQRDVTLGLQLLTEMMARDDARGDSSVFASLLGAKAEILYAGKEFGLEPDWEQASSLWRQVLTLAPEGDDAVAYAKAGLSCIDQNTPSTQCVALRCSIEGGLDCDAP